MNEIVSYLIVPTLVPMIPAFILFKFLPGEAVVKGKLSGLTFNLVGGFAGYFAVLWILLPYANGLRTAPVSTQQYHVYTVTGQLTFNGSNALPNNQVTFTAVSPRLPMSSITGTGQYTFYIPIGPDLSGNISFPEMEAECDGYGYATFPLANAKRDEVNHLISVTDPVNLVSAPPYHPTQTATPLN